MFERRETVYNITLPQPYPCKCGGTLFPIFRPAQLVLKRDYMGIITNTGESVVREGFNEVIWKCDNCNKEIR